VIGGIASETFAQWAVANPGRVVVEPEMPLDRHRDLDRRSRIDRRAMCDRQNGDDGGAVGFALDRENDHARPVFLSLFPSGLVLVVPEIGIGDDEARLRVGDRHEPPLLGVEQLVERSVPRIHARRADCFDFFLRQIGGGEAAAAFAEALELLIFVRADEVAGDLAVT
jgi:hypothetical protein